MNVWTGAPSLNRKKAQAANATSAESPQPSMFSRYQRSQQRRGAVSSARQSHANGAPYEVWYEW